MDNYNIAISQFADTCSIPRPTMSQILNGRNKKISDELITKIHLAYPDLSVLWLMFGEGDMLTKKNTQFSETSESVNRAGLESQLSNNEAATSAPTLPYCDTENPAKKNSEAAQSYVASKFSQTEPTSPANQYGQQEVERPTDKTSSQQKAKFDHPHHEVIDFDSNADFPPIYNRPSHSANQPLPKNAFTNNANQAAAQHATDTESRTPSTDNATTNNTVKPGPQNSMILPTDPGKQITNIVVFYSDNSFQSFYPIENSSL